MTGRSLSFFYGDTVMNNMDFYISLIRELAAGVNNKLESDLDRFRKLFYLEDPSSPPETKQVVAPAEPRRELLH